MVGRGVHVSPKSAARGLIDWAIDLWPYVNGKALVSGIRLGELSASDMVDVIHYFFEEDMNFTSSEQAEARSDSRTKIYSTMYNRPYKYASTSKQGGSNNFSDIDNMSFDDEKPLEDVRPFDPMKPPQKNFIAPTKFDPGAFNPFSGTLDAPMK